MDSIPEINLNTAKASAQKATATLKSAGSLVAKKAERTKLVTVTLPRAYAELGKAVYKEASLRQEFVELFKAADELLAQRKKIEEASKSRLSGSGIAEMAKKAASDAADLAKTKALDLRAFQAFAKLGEAVYQKHGNDSGSSQLVGPIANAVAKCDQLDRDLNAIESESKGRWFTPKRVAWGVGLLVAVSVVSGIVNDAKNGELGGGRSTDDTGTTASEEPPVKRSVWGATQLAYKKRIELCDNPDKYKNTEIKMEVKYRGGGLRQGGKLTDIRCTVFYGDGSFEMAFTIPSDVSQPRIEPGQYLWVTFVFSGSVDSPSRVTAISRK